MIYILYMSLDIPTSVRLAAQDLGHHLSRGTPWRVHDLVPGTVSSTQQSIEYKTFLRVLNLSDYSGVKKSHILNQEIICYKVWSIDSSNRFNLIIYVVDEQERVKRWDCYYVSEVVRDIWTREDFQSDVSYLQEEWFEFIPNFEN